MGRKAYETFTCSCGERCVMVPHEKSGKLAPITVAAYPNGNIELLQGEDQESSPVYRVVPPKERLAVPKPRPVSHWSNCPDAASFRR
jgi:hypothetical protein